MNRTSRSLIFAVVTLGICSGYVRSAEPPLPKLAGPLLTLKDINAKPEHNSRVIVEIHESGLLYIGLYTRTHAEMRVVFASCREQTKGESPTVLLFLYPALRSNNDLKRLRETVAFFDAEAIPWEMVICDPKEPIPPSLRSKPSKQKQ